MVSRAIAFPALWALGLAVGVAGTGLVFRAVTRGNGWDLLAGLALLLPGLYLSGTVLAHARAANTRARAKARES